jgi:membrane protease YdiL (CAAX protease family)
MKTTLAIIIAFVILFNGWLLLSGILHGIGYLLQVDDNSSVMYWINLLFMLFLSPIFGGFLSTYITPRLFEGVRANTIALGVISITLTLTVLISTVYVIFFLQDKSDIPKISEFAMFLVQALSLIAGAIGGKLFYHSVHP